MDRTKSVGRVRIRVKVRTWHSESNLHRLRHRCSEIVGAAA